MKVFGVSISHNTEFLSTTPPHQSPKSFDRSITTANTSTSKESYVSEEDDSDDDGSGNGRPVSVHDMRKQAAEKMKKPHTPESRRSMVHTFFQQ